MDRCFERPAIGNIITAWAADGGDFGWSFPEYALGFTVSPLDKNRLMVTDLGCAHLSARRRRNLAAGLHHASVAAKPQRDGQRRRVRRQRNGDDRHLAPALVRRERSVRLRHRHQRLPQRRRRPELVLRLPGPRTPATTYYAAADPRTHVAYAATSSIHDLYQSTRLADKPLDFGAGFVLSSADKGANWKVVHDFHKPVIWLALDPAKPNRMYASVVHSREGGNLCDGRPRPGAALGLGAPAAAAAHRRASVQRPRARRRDGGLHVLRPAHRKQLHTGLRRLRQRRRRPHLGRPHRSADAVLDQGPGRGPGRPGPEHVVRRRVFRVGRVRQRRAARPLSDARPREELVADRGFFGLARWVLNVESARSTRNIRARLISPPNTTGCSTRGMSASRSRRSSRCSRIPSRTRSASSSTRTRRMRCG